MKRSRKTNRVSWAPGVNLCQVKLFLKEECPSKVGGEHQDTLQAKTSWTLHPSGMCATDLPPGFEGSHYIGGYKYNLANIPRIQWKIPRKFALNFNWHVVAGEESQEVEFQKLRENRVLEAVYPRLTAIPPNPSVSPDVEVEHYDDSRIPLVPLTPIEDDEGEDVSSGIAVPKTASNFETPALLMLPGLSNSGTPNMPHRASSAAEEPIPGVSSDMMAAALTTVTKSKEQGGLVDTDLLVKILSDPEMVEKLIHNHGHPSIAADGNVVTAPSFVSEPEIGLTSLPCSKPATISSPMPADRNTNHLVKEFQPVLSMPVSRASIASNPNVSMISGHKAANGTSAAYSTLNQVHPALSMMPVQPATAITSTTAMQKMEASTVKDANYFKNLIREHGRQKEEAKAHNISQTGSHLNQIQNLKPGASKTKFRKPCMFYNSSKGCRQGSNCTYLHDNKSLQWQIGRTLETPSAKRMKLSGEITGRI
ncbi:hypothetical protein like AT1G19860 [Hibiscus trionum]|uniref:C3H1-type domain-containing protein n=1 Tax=Hibiscus trionum TaxID=183268 RepID=A0A9W7GVQ5_HIBTR|nr:hypothetical protein like AT1G19860 [Hibiscus trionum]